MPRKTDENIKDLIAQIGVMIDARNKTLEINLKAYLNDSLKTFEKRIRKDMATKDDIKNMATKDDIKRLEAKIDKTTDLQNQLDELKKRVKNIEENTRFQI